MAEGGDTGMQWSRSPTAEVWSSDGSEANLELSAVWEYRGERCLRRGREVVLERNGIESAILAGIPRTTSGEGFWAIRTHRVLKCFAVGGEGGWEAYDGELTLAGVTEDWEKSDVAFSSHGAVVLVNLPSESGGDVESRSLTEGALQWSQSFPERLSSVTARGRDVWIAEGERVHRLDARSGTVISSATLRRKEGGEPNLAGGVVPRVWVKICGEELLAVGDEGRSLFVLHGDSCRVRGQATLPPTHTISRTSGMFVEAEDTVCFKVTVGGRMSWATTGMLVVDPKALTGRLEVDSPRWGVRTTVSRRRTDDGTWSYWVKLGEGEAEEEFRCGEMALRRLIALVGRKALLEGPADEGFSGEILIIGSSSATEMLDQLVQRTAAIANGVYSNNDAKPLSLRVANATDAEYSWETWHVDGVTGEAGGARF